MAPKRPHVLTKGTAGAILLFAVTLDTVARRLQVEAGR